MPHPALKSFAQQSGKSLDTLEKYWDKAKELADEQGHKDDYDYITGITKRMAGIAEEYQEEYKSFFHKLK